MTKQATSTEAANLIGVFRRLFPIAAGQVNGQEGKTIRVTYCGKPFDMVGESGSSRYAFRVFAI